MKQFERIFRPKPAAIIRDRDFEQSGIRLNQAISAIFGKSLSIREVDSGSDNAAEIEMVNLSTPYYDIERFGVTFVSSPRHADVLAITGAVTHNMEIAVRKTYEAMPFPKLVIAIGDDACGTGIWKNSYAVSGAAENVIPVDLKIPGNPPTPLEIIIGLLGLMRAIRSAQVSNRNAARTF